MTIIKMTEAVIRTGATDKSFPRGRELYRSGAISNAWIQGQRLSGECLGNEAPFYKVRVELDSGGIRSATCTCPYDFGGYCKHIVALLLAYAQKPKQFAVRQEPTELLSDLTREQLLALVTKLLREQPDLYEWVEATLTLPTASGKGKYKTAKRKQVDTTVYQRRVRAVMHSLDKTIKRLAGTRWSRLKSEMMATLEKSYDKQPLAEVLLLDKEWDAAIKVADQKGAYHTVVETVAEALIPHRPEWVIRASIKQAEELIVQTKSNLYPAAADWFKRAKAAYAKLGRTSEWQKYLQQLKEQYKRRPALQAQLAKL